MGSWIDPTVVGREPCARGAFRRGPIPGLSQEELDHRLYLSGPGLRRLNPTLETLLRLHVAAGCSIGPGSVRSIAFEERAISTSRVALATQVQGCLLPVGDLFALLDRADAGPDA